MNPAATETVKTRMRCGMAPALAIHITAGEYGIPSRTLACALSRRRRTPRTRQEPPQNAWWTR